MDQTNEQKKKMLYMKNKLTQALFDTVNDR